MRLHNRTRSLGIGANHRRASPRGGIEHECLVRGSPVGMVPVEGRLGDLSRNTTAILVAVTEVLPGRSRREAIRQELSKWPRWRGRRLHVRGGWRARTKGLTGSATWFRANYKQLSTLRGVPNGPPPHGGPPRVTGLGGAAGLCPADLLRALEASLQHTNARNHSLIKEGGGRVSHTFAPCGQHAGGR